MARGLKWRVCAALAAVSAVWFIGLTSAGAEPPMPVADGHAVNGLCLVCHGQELTVRASVGQERTIDAVELKAFNAAAHKGLECVDCHPVQSALPHLKPEGLGRLGATDPVACQECHPDAYEGYRDGPHGTMAKLGDDRAPACGDCHGNPHYVQLVRQWTEDDRAAACAQCHSGANTSFVEASLGHKPPSAGFLSTPYFAGLFLMILTAATLAFGIIHVELEMLRWLVRWWRSHSARTAGDGHRS